MHTDSNVIMKLMYNKYMLIKRIHLIKLLCRFNEIIVEMLNLYPSCSYAQ